MLERDASGRPAKAALVLFRRLALGSPDFLLHQLRGGIAADVALGFPDQLMLEEDRLAVAEAQRHDPP